MAIFIDLKVTKMANELTWILLMKMQDAFMLYCLPIKSSVIMTLILRVGNSISKWGFNSLLSTANK